MFGSVATDTDTVDSDLDLVVTSGPDMTMFDIIALEEDLEALHGVPVDVVTQGAIRSGGRPWSNLESVAV